MIFKSEDEMSKIFESFILSKIADNSIFVLKEIKGLFGIPDFVLIDNLKNHINYIISIELKLRNWKRALNQAFRYRAFSNESYVILDEHYIELGLKNIEYFKKFNIGLGSINLNSEIKIFYKPLITRPYSTKFNSILEKYFLNSIDNSKIIWNNFFDDKKLLDNIRLYSKFMELNHSNFKIQRSRY